MGLAVAPLNAFTAGTASLPDPLADDSDDNWMWHQYFQVRAPKAFTGNASVDSDALLALACVFQFEIDTKAMRKVPQAGDVVYGKIEGSLSGTATLNFNMNTRMLSKSMG